MIKQRAAGVIRLVMMRCAKGSEMGQKYMAYLLRLWQAGSVEESTWRASLEDPHSRQVIGFNSLDELYHFLLQVQSDWRGDLNHCFPLPDWDRDESPR